MWIILLSVCITPAVAQQTVNRPKADELRVFRLDPQAAERISRVLKTMYPPGEADSPKIVLDQNNVVVRAPAELQEGIAQVIDRLDRPLQIVRTEIVLVARADDAAADAEQFARELSRVAKPIQVELNRLRGGGSWRLVEWMQLTTLDQQPAFAQLGKTKPLQPKDPDEPLEPNDERANVGAILGLTPRVEADQSVTMELSFDRSAQGNILDRNPAPPSAPTPIDFIRIQTTIKILANRAVVLGGMRQIEGPESRDWRLVVSATLLDAPGNP